MTKDATVRKDAAKNIQRILEALPASNRGLVEKTGLCESTVAYWVQKLLLVTHECHIHSYSSPANGTGRPQVIYAAGPAPKGHVPHRDRPKKTRKKSQAKTAESRHAKWLRLRKEQVAKELSRKPFRDPLVTALFGPHQGEINGHTDWTSHRHTDDSLDQADEIADACVGAVD